MCVCVWGGGRGKGAETFATIGMIAHSHLKGSGGMLTRNFIVLLRHSYKAIFGLI